MAHGRLERKFAAFLKRERGEMSFSEFAHRLRIPRSTLYWAENLRGSIPLNLVEEVAKRLDRSVLEILGEEATASLKRPKRGS